MTMGLKLEDIQKILKGELKGDRAEISPAISHEERVRLHCEITMNRQDTSPALEDLLRKVKFKLPDDAYKSFVENMDFPLPTVSLMGRVFTSLSKVFDGKNQINNTVFSSDNESSDWDAYRGNKLKIDETWKTIGWETMKLSINSIMIVDIDNDSDDKNPAPYFYFLPLTSVVDFKRKNNEVMEWIVFNIGNEKIAVFDDESFQVFKKKDASSIETTPEIHNTHDLGYCPGRMFWTTPLNYSRPVVKKSPASSQLGRLDKLFFYDVSNDHLNLYARFPIYSSIAGDCDFEDQVAGHYCQQGYLKGRNDQYLMNGSIPIKCPVCSDRRLNGAGSFVVYDTPNDENGHTNMKDPVGVLTIPRESLDYNNIDIAQRREAIFAEITGFQGTPVNNKAINEKQVLAMFESLEAALDDIQINLEAAMKWVNETVCKLRYKTFISNTVSLGTEHFILEPSQLLELYSISKEASFSISTLDMLEDRYYESEYKNNPDMLLRQRIINNLDPLRHKSDQDATNMYKDGQISFEDFITKVNFSTFIMRFERENVSLLEFGQKLNFDKKIKNIKTALNAYAEEMMPKVGDTNGTQQKVAGKQSSD